MITTLGEYVDNVQNVKYSLLMISDNTNVSVYLALGGRVVSAFKHEGEDDYCLSNKLAKIAYDKVATGLKKCSSSNCNPIPFELGVASRYMAEAKGTSYTIEKFGKDISGLEIADEKYYMFAEYTNQNIQIPSELNWVKIGRPKKKEADEFGDIDNNDIPVRSLSEIALEKDLTWLDKKRYYIVNEDESVEYVISAIEDYVRKYNGIVAYDVETSGLFINMFGKIGSSKQKDMEAINAERAKRDLNPYRVDTLTGLILTITPDESFYFPVRNRKFKNAYDDVDSEVRKKTTSKIKADYTIGEFRTRDDDMAKWIRSHKEEEFTSDIILMERLRWLLTHANICAHNGVMEWKTTWLYNIDLNLRDDTMIMHKLMYKFNDMSRGNAGERSDLKYLTKTRLGIDQLELTDFFVDYKEDDSGLVNASGKRKGKKKSGVRIDFSYMDYDGAKAYAPADGDFTLQLCHMFKKDLLENHRNMEYLYQVEIIVSCAIAYMEFYGHRIDENKIDEIRHDQLIEQLMLEGKFRKQIEYANEKENEALANLEWAYKKVKELRKSKADKEEIIKALNNRTELANVYREILNESDKPMNMASPQQISNLFYNELHYMEAKPGEKESIGKKVLKQYTKMKNEDGSPKYPAIVTYTEWKSVDTLLTKFFDNLPDFMYPGGYIFSSFGQISTATGRMSCAKPNVQQYPKSVSAIVIPRDGCVMIDADFSQIEYRTLVAMAHEDALLERFKDPDMDYHTTMASLMYGVPYASVTPKMRGDAKSFNFGIPYGMGFGSLAILLNGNKSKQSVEEAKEKYELYFKEQPNVRKFFGDVKAKAKFNGQTETLWHRVRKYNFLDKNGNYSQKLEAQGLRQAGNAIIQGTAADIFKIAVARTFLYIRNNNLFEKFYITNMVHDEQLTEIDVRKLNPKVALKGLVEAMELKLDGFPPLFVGAGVGDAWAHAKGKMAEIHPDLADEFVKEASNEKLYLDKPMTPEEVIKYFDNRVYEYRKNRVIEYITDPKNFGEPIYPVIGNLLSLQFDFGVTSEFNAEYTEENGYTKEQIDAAMKGIVTEQIKRFIEEFNVDADYRNFIVETDLVAEEEEEDGYDDDEVDEDGIPLDIIDSSSFELIDEDDKVYGIKYEDIIKTYGVLVSPKHKICGISTANLSERVKCDFSSYLAKHACDSDEDGAMQVVYLKENDFVLKTEVYVKDVTSAELSKILRIHRNKVGA